MRVLIIGRSKPGHAEAGIRRALRRAGHEAVLVDDVKTRHWLGQRLADAWLRARARAFRPDRIIWGKSLAFTPGALADVAQLAPAVMYYLDLRVPPDEEIVARARVAETVFLSAGGQAGLFEALGTRRALFLPSAAHADLDRPAEPDPAFASDVAFIGSGYDAYRAELLARLAERFRVRVWGPGWERWAGRLNWAGREVRGADFARVCASTKIVLGINPSFQVGARVHGYTSNRVWRILACGGFYLGHASPGLRELLRDGGHCAWYDDEEHAAARIEHYLSRDAERERIRAAGRAFVHAHHTLDRRIDHLLTGEPFLNPLQADAN